MSKERKPSRSSSLTPVDQRRSTCRNQKSLLFEERRDFSPSSRASHFGAWWVGTTCESRRGRVRVHLGEASYVVARGYREEEGGKVVDQTRYSSLTPHRHMHSLSREDPDPGMKVRSRGRMM